MLIFSGFYVAMSGGLKLSHKYAFPHEGIASIANTIEKFGLRVKVGGG